MTPLDRLPAQLEIWLLAKDYNGSKAVCTGEAKDAACCRKCLHSVEARTEALPVQPAPQSGQPTQLKRAAKMMIGMPALLKQRIYKPPHA